MRTKHSLSALALGASLLMSTATMAAPDSPQKEPGRLTVSADAQIEATPDIAIIRAQLTEYTPFSLNEKAHKATRLTADAARQRLETRMGELILQLERAGIPSRNIEAGSLSAQIDTERRRTASNDDYETWIRTRIDRPISIELHNLERVTEAMDMLTHVGIDTIRGVSYEVNNPDRYEQAVLAKAIKKAKEEAKIMAKGLDSELVRVLNVHKTHDHRTRPTPMNRSLKVMTVAQKEQPSEYRAGDLDIHSNVTVIWEISNAD